MAKHPKRRRVLRWWECFVLGGIAVLVSEMTKGDPSGGMLDFGVVNSKNLMRVTPIARVAPGWGYPPMASGTSRISYDVFLIGLTHTWFANVSYLDILASDIEANASDADRVTLRDSMVQAARFETRLVIPMPAFDWVFRVDFARPVLSEYTRVNGNRYPRAFPNTGQRAFAGINPVGIFGEVAFWCAFVLIPLGICRAAATLFDPFREPTWRKRLRLGLCPNCKYSIDRSIQTRCPECGHSLSAYPRECGDDALSRQSDETST